MEFDFRDFPELVSERLLLRSLQPTDANEIFALRSDDNVNKYIERKKATSIEDAYRFIEMIAKNVSNNETLLWAIELKQTHAFAGTVLLWNINKEKDEIELGYELLPAYHGKGIMQEAIEVVLRFAFDSLKFSSVVAIAHKENIPSLKVLQRNNFELKNEMEDNMLEYILHVKNFNKV